MLLQPEDARRHSPLVVAAEVSCCRRNAVVAEKLSDILQAEMSMSLVGASRRWTK